MPQTGPPSRLGARGLRQIGGDARASSRRRARMDCSRRTLTSTRSALSERGRSWLSAYRSREADANGDRSIVCAGSSGDSRKWSLAQRHERARRTLAAWDAQQTRRRSLRAGAASARLARPRTRTNPERASAPNGSRFSGRRRFAPGHGNCARPGCHKRTENANSEAGPPASAGWAAHSAQRANTSVAGMRMLNQ